MTYSIYNKDFRFGQKATLCTFYVKGYKWLSFKANIKPAGFHSNNDTVVCYNVQISKLAFSLVVDRSGQ